MIMSDFSSWSDENRLTIMALGADGWRGAF
jgi:hypothetical protein